MIIITKSHQLPKELDNFLSVSGFDLRECIVDIHEAMKTEHPLIDWQNTFKVKFMDIYNDPETTSDEKELTSLYCVMLFDTIKTWITDQKHLWIMASQYQLLDLILEKDKFIYKYGDEYVH